MRKWQNCNFPFSAECGGTPAGGESTVHKLMDAMSSAQKLRGAGLTPHFHAERSSNGSCGSPPRRWKNPRRRLMSRVSIGPSRQPVVLGSSQFDVISSLHVCLSGYSPDCLRRGQGEPFEAYPSMFSPSFPATWLAQRAWMAWKLSASGLKWIPSSFPFVCVVFLQESSAGATSLVEVLERNP